MFKRPLCGQGALDSGNASAGYHVPLIRRLQSRPGKGESGQIGLLEKERKVSLQVFN